MVLRERRHQTGNLPRAALRGRQTDFISLKNAQLASSRCRSNR